MKKPRRWNLHRRGDIPVRFYPQDSKKKFLAPRGLWVSRNAAALEALRAILGAENVVLR